MTDSDDWLTPMQALAHKILEDQRMREASAMEAIIDCQDEMREAMEKLGAMVVGATVALQDMLESATGSPFLTVEDNEPVKVTQDKLLEWGGYVEEGGSGDVGLPGGGSSGSGRSDGVVGDAGASGSPVKPRNSNPR
jgi:hypothetical protein